VLAWGGLAVGWAADLVADCLEAYILVVDLAVCCVEACIPVAYGGSNHNYDTPMMTHGERCRHSPTRTRRTR